MNRLVAMLALTTAVFGASTAYLAYRLYVQAPLATGAAPAADATRSVPNQRPAPTPAPQSKSAPSPSVVATPPAGELPTPHPRPSGFEREFLERESDPERRAQLLEETQVGVRREYPGLERVRGIDTATAERLLSLLAEHRLQMRKASIECKYASTCGSQLPQLHDAQQAELAALLGPDGQQGFAQYLESRAERLSVSSMRGRLTDKNRLPDAQAEKLTLVLADERRRIAEEMTQQGEFATMTFDGIPFVYRRGITYEGLMEQARAYQTRLRSRAATLLTPEQLAVYDQQAAEKMIVVGAMVQSTVQNQSKSGN